ncbi:MAG: hypothetical protein HOQ28_20540 [Thermoleophilia bacterium]|nr:hypothetical protein [Thermoleophilia bacterium]
MRGRPLQVALLIAALALAASRAGQSEAALTKLRAGTYLLAVSDRSSIHDFHISGPGLNKVVTGVAFFGTKTIRIKLRRGTDRYVCDPHRTLMHGRFTVS